MFATSLRAVNAVALARTSASPSSPRTAASAGLRLDAGSAAAKAVPMRPQPAGGTVAGATRPAQSVSAPAALQPAAAPALSPVASSAGSFIAGAGSVVVDILNSDSGYANQIYWSSDNFATRNLIGIDNQTATVDLGVFKAGTRIDFGIVNGVNQFFRSGSAADNSDGFEHARTFAGTNGLVMGFEDLLGGGDRDFNDAIVQVRGLAGPAAAPAPMPAPMPQTVLQTVPQTAAQPVPVAVVPVPKPKAKSGNRSGLGDGTNPGIGSGRSNSPNVGTLNPNQTAPVAANKTAGPAPAVAARSEPTRAGLSASNVRAEETKKLLASSYGALAPSTPSATPPGKPRQGIERAKV